MATSTTNIPIGPVPVAIVTGTFLSGTLMSLYTITYPALFETFDSTPKLLQQWAQIFDRGHIQGPALAIGTSALYGYRIWQATATGERWTPYAAALALTLGIVPYTWIFMGKINYALFDMVYDTRKPGAAAPRSELVLSMVRKWTRLHAVRSMLPFAGAVIGLLGMVGYV